MLRFTAAFAVIGCTTLLAACEGGGGSVSDTSPDSVVRRDSAGIEIVENPATMPAGALEFVLGDKPITEIGDDRRGSVYGLARPSAIRLPNGTIVVGDGEANDVRVFTAAGDYLGTAGRQGVGPGDFAGVGMLATRGDSIVVYDPLLERFSIFSTTGDLLRTVVRDSAAKYADPVGLLSNGWVLAVRWPLRPHGRNQAPPDSAVPYHSVIHRISLSSGEADSLLSIAGMRRRQVMVNGSLVERNPFHVEPAIATDGGRIFAADRLSSEVRVYSAEGELRRIIRHGLSGEPLERARERYEARRFPKLPASPESTREEEHQRMVKAALEYPERLPPFGRLMADGAGRLWVQAYRIPTTPGSEPLRFTVYGDDGAILGHATFPGEHTLLEIGADYAIFIQLINDAPYIRVMPLLERR